jgi:hypothetical protein
MNDSWNCTVNGQPVASNLAITIGGGETAECSFTNSKLGSIDGHKFIDQNGNTNQETGEPILTYADIPGGVQIFIDTNANGAFETGEQTVNTDATGYYKLDQLAASTYFVCEVVPTGWTASFPSNVPSYPNCQQINIAPGENVSHDFGNFKLGAIQGRKYQDDSMDGTRQAPEPWLGGWTINLYDSSWTSKGTIVTANTTGLYRFDNLTKDTYYTCEVMQPDWKQTGPIDLNVNQVVNGSPNSANEGPICWRSVINQSGQERTGRQFGNVRLASMSVDKITLPSGDPQSFNMYIKKNDVSVDEFQLADADPVHINNTLVPGTYSLTEAVPNGWMNDSWNCTVNGQPVASNLAITINAGDQAVCS